MTVSELPPFRWDPVAGADRYEFEFAADPGFNGATMVSTKNTRAALKLLVPNGTYYWRVRGVTSGGDVGAWSDVRSLDMAWTAQAALLAPSNGATITYPDHALELRWGAVQGAAKYLVKVASDPDLGTLVFGEPVETASTQFTLNDPMPPGTYYWGITPLNAQGHEGAASTVASFTWSWPSTSTPTYTDLSPDPELVDPHFSWTPVLGAAGYQVEVNFSSDWASGSKVCCDPINFFTQASTLGTSLSPDGRTRQQHLLLARARDRLRGQRRRLERRPVLHQDVRQRASRDGTQHRERPHARQHRRPRRRHRRGDRRARHRYPGRRLGARDRGLRLHGERDHVLGRRLQLGQRTSGTPTPPCAPGRRSAGAGSPARPIRRRCPRPPTRSGPSPPAPSTASASARTTGRPSARRRSTATGRTCPPTTRPRSSGTGLRRARHADRPARCPPATTTARSRERRSGRCRSSPGIRSRARRATTSSSRATRTSRT